jgi:hypothetical protein
MRFLPDHAGVRHDEGPFRRPLAGCDCRLVCMVQVAECYCVALARARCRYNLQPRCCSTPMLVICRCAVRQR